MERLTDIADAVRIALARLGPLALGGAGLALVAAAGFVAFVQPLDTEIDGLRRKLATATERVKSDPLQGPLKVVSESDALRAFYTRFPALPAVPELVAKLESIARTNGVALESGEYTLTDEKGAKVMRYEVALPVRGNYGQIRTFVHEALGAAPSAALESVTLKRDLADKPMVEAKLRMTIYVARSAP